MQMRWALAAAAVLAGVAMPAHAAAPVGPAYEASAHRPATAGSRDGLQLSVHLPPGPYVRNMLIRATVEVRNLGPRSVLLVRSVCPNGNLFAEVQNRPGRTVYPPAVSGPPPIHCFAPTGTVLLHPGARIRRHMLIILRGRYIRAVTYVTGAGATGAGYIEGPAVAVPLARGTPPRVTVQTQPYVLVTVTPSSPQETGTLWYQESALCQYPDSTSGATGSGSISTRWEKAPIGRDGYTFEPPCTDHVQWHLVTGWLNSPVTSVNYSRP